LTRIIFLIDLFHDAAGIFRDQRTKEDAMKRATIVLLVSLIAVFFTGWVLAAEMSGEVTAVDAANGALTLKSGTLEAGFDCEKGSLIKDVKVGDMVTVEYKEAGGKKIVTKVAPAAPMKKRATGGY
jgi:hypothetical protein